MRRALAQRHGGGVLSTRVHEGVRDQPLVVAGHPVTFWHAVDPDGISPTTADLAQLLRRLHAHRDSPCSLPRFDPVPEIRRRLDTGLDLPEADQHFIQARCDVLDSLLPAVAPTLPQGPIHGDAHTGNLLRGVGATLLTDFEACAAGPREWDLVPVAVGYERLGLPSERWEQFVTGYGFDVRGWSGYPVLREIRELGMTTWLAQNLAEGEPVRREVAVRLESLRTGDRDRAWTPF
ncbi:MAG: phosphotransferase enzyme family protein [Natronosporangium sp.]